MAKAATVKDVLYALEYTGARLCMWPSATGSGGSWSIEPAGIKVSQSVADEARAHSGIVASPDVTHGRAVYVWRGAA